MVTMSEDKNTPKKSNFKTDFTRVIGRTVN